MARAPDYKAMLRTLLPQGAAWTSDPGGVLDRFLDALSLEFARVDGRAQDLLAESDPRTTTEMFTDWERFLGLPDPCVPDDENQTLQQRRDSILAKLRATGGQSINYFLALADAIGYSVTISEHQQFRAGIAVAGDPLTNGDWVFWWRVNAPEETIYQIRAGQSFVGEPIRVWGNYRLVCEFNAKKPAHTKIMYEYG